MDRTEELALELLNAIRESDMYRGFINSQERIMADPELKERIDQYRAHNYRMQQDPTRDHFTLVDQVSQELTELRKIPEVNQYLDLELALCREVQKVCRILIEGIEMETPDL